MVRVRLLLLGPLCAACHLLRLHLLLLELLLLIRLAAQARDLLTGTTDMVGRPVRLLLLLLLAHDAAARLQCTQALPRRSTGDLLSGVRLLLLLPLLRRLLLLPQGLLLCPQHPWHLLPAAAGPTSTAGAAAQTISSGSTVLPAANAAAAAAAAAWQGWC